MREKLCLLVTNLSLLGIDVVRPDVSISTRTFTNLENHKRASEVIFYHLFKAWDPLSCKERFSKCYPCHDSTQAKEFRNAIFKWLNELKRDRLLGSVIVRRSLLDDCAGERYEDLLLSLSTLVFLDSVKKKLAIEKQLPYIALIAMSPDSSTEALKVLEIVQAYALKKTVVQHRNARARYTEFALELTKWSLPSGVPGNLSDDPIRSDALQIQNVIGSEIARISRLNASTSLISCLKPLAPVMDSFFITPPWKKTLDTVDHITGKEPKLPRMRQRCEGYLKLARKGVHRMSGSVAERTNSPDKAQLILPHKYECRWQFTQPDVSATMTELRTKLEELEPGRANIPDLAAARPIAPLRNPFKRKALLVPRPAYAKEIESPIRKRDLLRTVLSKGPRVSRASGLSPLEPPTTPERRPSSATTSTIKSIGRLVDLLNDSSELAGSPTKGQTRSNNRSSLYKHTANRSIGQQFRLWDTNAVD